MADIFGSQFSDFNLSGTNDDDNIFGLGGFDRLFGLGGDDFLDGGDGDDRLTGGIGSDRLRGGAGFDSFLWALGSFAGSDSVFAAPDLVEDFEGAGVDGGDTLTLSSPPDSRPFVFAGALAAMPALGGTLGGGGNGFTEVFYAFDGAETVLLADSNDDGLFDANDFAVRFSGLHSFTTFDFSGTVFTIVGTPGNDTINGTEGDDSIVAFGGNDTVDGLGGRDTIDGGTGNDTLDGGAGDDGIQGGDGNDTIDGGTGNDRINDGLHGGNGNDTIHGGDGLDFLRGDAGDDSLFGDAANDRVAGGDGNDLVEGGDGNDVLDGDDGDDIMIGGLGNDDFFGGAGNDIMDGGDGDDELFGMDGDDIIDAGKGEDEIAGEAGADILEGGADADEFQFFQAAHNPSSTFGASDFILDFEGGGEAGGDELDIRQLGQSVFHGQLAISLTLGAAQPGANNGFTDIFYVQDGDTTLVGDTNDNGLLDNEDMAIVFKGKVDLTPDDINGIEFVIVGTDGDDTIVGTAADDNIFGLGGNDTINGLEGSDEISGGEGNDTLIGGVGPGFDQLSGDAGDDIITLDSDFGGIADGGDGNDVLTGSNVGFSQLIGGAGDDVLHAGARGAELSGGAGADRMFSGVFNDRFDGDPDGAQDLYVYAGTQAWSTPNTLFGDRLFNFEDGVDLFDLRGSGFTADDIVFAEDINLADVQPGTIYIDNDDFQTTIVSDRGSIAIFEQFGQPVEITAADFLFG